MENRKFHKISPAATAPEISWKKPNITSPFSVKQSASFGRAPKTMSYRMGLDPQTQTTVRMQLYEQVQNAGELKTKLMSGELQCCIIKPDLIVDALQVVVAANKALTSRKQTTRSPFTEILFNLSPSSNISQSLSKFGIDEQSQSLLVVALVGAAFEGSERVFCAVQGSPIDISELGCLTDVPAIRKTYRIGDVEHQNVTLLDSVVSRIASKD